MTDDRLTLGSLCTGYGGLDLACRDVLGTRTAWVAENDPHAARVCRARFKAPNLGDIKAIDWADIQRVDVLTAGYPCQPFSHAGKRRGTDDPRHIWPYIAEGVRHLRPRLIVLENVAGHLTKGFGEVVGTLAAMGYDATWGCVRASDAGAPHRRARVFIVATDAENVGHERPRVARGRGDGPTDRGDAAPDADGAGRQGRGRPVERPRELAAAPGGVEPLLPTPTAADGERRSLTYCRGNPTLIGALKMVAEWGEYAAAIARWEPIIGRPVPDPVDDGRLSSRFVEWMMGLPRGWVTAVPGLSRTQELKILGNGVVFQQATLALHLLLPRL